MSGPPPSPSQQTHQRFEGLLREMPSGHILALYVRPRSSCNGFAGIRQDPSTGRHALVVNLQAPPVDGAANRLIVRFLAKCLSIPQSDVTLVSGEASKHKSVLILRRPRHELLVWLSLVVPDVEAGRPRV